MSGGLGRAVDKTRCFVSLSPLVLNKSKCAHSVVFGRGDEVEVQAKVSWSISTIDQHAWSWRL